MNFQNIVGDKSLRLYERNDIVKQWRALVDQERGRLNVLRQGVEYSQVLSTERKLTRLGVKDGGFRAANGGSGEASENIARKVFQHDVAA
jgi:hypothetical protein